MSLTPEQFGAALSMIGSLDYERGRVHCTKDAPWDRRRAPVTHHGVNNVIKPFNDELDQECCEFCGATIHFVRKAT